MKPLNTTCPMATHPGHCGEPVSFVLLKRPDSSTWPNWSDPVTGKRMDGPMGVCAGCAAKYKGRSPWYDRRVEPIELEEINLRELIFGTGTSDSA